MKSAHKCGPASVPVLHGDFSSVGMGDLGGSGIDQQKQDSVETDLSVQRLHGRQNQDIDLPSVPCDISLAAVEIFLFYGGIKNKFIVLAKKG